MSKAPEVRFHIELHKVLHGICSRGPVGGLALRAMVNEPRLDGRTPDIVVVREPDKTPVLIVETKRKS